MPRYKATMHKIVTFVKVIEVEAENDLKAGDVAEDLAEAHTFEWGSTDDVVIQIEDLREV